MDSSLECALDRLSSTQRDAVAWADGAALVLAGPGVGKTTVLTARLARILDESRTRNFRVLALTFTTKAGDEMRSRVEQLVPGLIDRAVIGTFHSFCAQVLRQHGSHQGIKPDFAVYDQDSDRLELFREALREAVIGGKKVSTNDVVWLKTIDKLRSGLVGPKKAATRFRDERVGAKVSLLYDIYEAALRERNVMDFSGLILDACRLVRDLPGVAARVRHSYPYWLIDEFQDTSPAQYMFIRLLAGHDFKNVFAVADDDQIIYQWAGASYRQLERFRNDFQPKQFQLVENRRCPPAVVSAANNLVSHNSERTPDKAPLVSMKMQDGDAIAVRCYETEEDEAHGVAREILSLGGHLWGGVAVIGRTRAILAPILDALRSVGVKASIVTRRDRFMSPHFCWLQACLDQSIRPTDRQVFTVMANAANSIAGIELDAELILVEAESSGRSFLETWARAAKGTEISAAIQLAAYAERLVEARGSWRAVVNDALRWFAEMAASAGGEVTDVMDDKGAWEAATRAIRAEKGGNPDLHELLQGLALRPKEPPQDPDAVSLLTIHAAKGLEFDRVWVVGMAEDFLPSWQSLQPDAPSNALEEERRNCFVAITRTERFLTLTRAKSYRGRPRCPSRFFGEMGLMVE